MKQESNALRLADECDFHIADFESISAELRRLHHNNGVLMDALWKACGDDEETVNATIESQGTLK